MLAEERRIQIIELARNEGRVDAVDAASRMAVAVETIRRDLDVLQRRGLIRRVHGGAISAERYAREYSVAERRTINREIKEKIATFAATYIPSHGTIFVDAGTTTECMAPHLRDRKTLTVVTNSLILAAGIGDSETNVILVSGRIRPITLSAVGSLTIAALENIQADLAFIGTNGIDAKYGFTTADSDEAAVKRKMIENSRESIVLSDHAKFGRSYTVRFADTRTVDRLVTDVDAPTSIIDELKSSGLEVVIV